MSEIRKMKNADNLSTLKDNDNRGSVESMLKENVGPTISTDRENNNPTQDPRIAKEFPHQFAKRSFLLKAKAPTAPANHNRSDRKNIFDEISVLNIFIGRPWRGNRTFQGFAASCKVLLLETAGLREY